ncbi:hypothetical protein COCSUDRAFT_55327 [Coccomyxa subellipsoidea C-169]|uniref:Uncharacterized protein n=1 Tax=Coccomyxa subellipsoidea (strain C-169) TaxID=574566 RepID=I0Z9I9_COCSC|nr:hypothetical protein COCSUDRAFT_55327 [Coccomyxa subellipsoidea C-169]EIE27308.1 hypothetical protein COCSUDRAFT_55327 [Coccomyxa subellipsoidea C-169]|eukprot:XP_005651852.1 hypothetical protein COCSUDRAFT_55327 [Coccomyxa subellipsoidea C-169]
MSFMQRGPLLDTQDLFGSEPVALKVQSPASVADAAALPMEEDTQGPELNLCLGMDTQAEQPVQPDTFMQDAEAEPSLQKLETKDEMEAKEMDGEEEHEEAEGDEERSASDDEEGHADDEGGSGDEEEEEEFLSSDDSSSDEEDEAEAGQPLDSATKQRALEEARALLRDEPRKKNKSAFFEDEARHCL